MAEIAPYLMYENATAAIDFLCDAFGFREIVRSRAPDDGRVWHAELELDGARLYLGQPDEFRSPKRLGGVTVAVHVYVDDLDAHFERARAAGATVTAEPDDRDYGERRYKALDPEGHAWMFSTPIGEPSPAWTATLTSR